MTAARSDRGRAYEEEDDGAVATFAPTLPRTPRRRPAPPAAPPPRAPERPAPRPEARSEARPRSPLAELFAEEDAADLAPRPDPAPVPSAPRVAVRSVPVQSVPSPPAAIAVRVRPDERPEPETGQVETGEATGAVEVAPHDEPAPVERTTLAEPIWVGVARGVSGVLAAGVLTGAALTWKGGTHAGPAWLAHLAPLPGAAVGPVLAYCGTALGLFAVRPALPTPARWGATLAAAAVAGVALKAAATAALADGIGPSLALHVAVCGGVALAGTRWSPAGCPVRGGRLAPLAGVLACLLTFPLADGVPGEVPAQERTAAGAARAVTHWWIDAARVRTRTADDRP